MLFFKVNYKPCKCEKCICVYIRVTHFDQLSCMFWIFTWIPRDLRWSAGPMPDSMSSLGLPTAPQLRMISFLALTVHFSPVRNIEMSSSQRKSISILDLYVDVIIPSAASHTPLTPTFLPCPPPPPIWRIRRTYICVYIQYTYIYIILGVQFGQTKNADSVFRSKWCFV